MPPEVVRRCCLVPTLITEIIPAAMSLNMLVEVVQKVGGVVASFFWTDVLFGSIFVRMDTFFVALSTLPLGEILSTHITYVPAIVIAHIS